MISTTARRPASVSLEKLREAFVEFRRGHPGMREKFPDALRDLVLAALGSGHAPLVVGRTAGVARSTISRWQREEGVSPRQTKLVKPRQLRVVSEDAAPEPIASAPAVSSVGGVAVVRIGRDIAVELPLAALDGGILRAAAFSFESTMKEVKAKYVLGLTATPTRKDGHHPIIIMQCGPIRYRVNPKQQAAERPFDHVVFPRRTTISRPSGDMNYQELCGVLANDTERNDLIIADIAKVLSEGRNPLVLTERKEHVDLIAARLAGRADHLITMYGGRTKKERQVCIDRLKAAPAGESRVLVATGKYIGEGFDDPRLDTLFLVLPISWKGTLQQYAGRLHRLYDGKLEVRVYDYVDSSVPMAWAMYEKRKRAIAQSATKSHRLNRSRDRGGASEAIASHVAQVRHKSVAISPLQSYNVREDSPLGLKVRDILPK